MVEVKINTEYIKLDQFLKWSGVCSCGAEAKELITSGNVLVNENIEIRRGAKLRIGDVIEVEGTKYIIT